MGRKSKAKISESSEESDQEIGGSDGSINKEKTLYEILGVEKTASQQEIKKAYHKLALRLHPDKNPGDEDAKEKFQLLQKVISILGNEEKRALYDQTGCTDDEAFSGEAAQNLQEFFRTMYRKITDADIEEFEASYRGSDSEKKDLKDLYIKYKGNMDRLFCSMLCSDPKLDSHRFMDIINEAIAEGELKATKAYKNWAKRISEIKPPTDPLVRRSKSKKRKKVESDLVAIIAHRQNERKERFNSIFSSVMANCNAEAPPEPTEEEFLQARARLENKRKSKKQKKLK